MSLNRTRILQLSTIFFAEFFGTAIMVFIVCFGGVNDYEFYRPTLATMSFCSGLAPMIVINIFGHISGAHINPAVTIAAFVLKFIDFSTVIIYIIGQILGSVFGYLVMRFSIYTEYLQNPESFCMHLPTTTCEKAFIIEIAITFVLILVICGCWDPRNVHNQDSTSLRVGFSVLVLTFIGGSYTGGSMNPARSFAPAIYNWNWDYHWIYWVGPILGSIIASVLYRFVFYKKKINETNENEIIESGNEEEQLRSVRNARCDGN
ncbi:hypothetical protein PVAND_006309 [Polypedilum vanderplanki]|uniref:Aquaporin n=1 Tax=Polypedilum vanderplanki TaxID=319348 RepID=A0A9J6C4J5_POLVA|nr:hypothetical protein PVAND_006309 [Polypedilum vanderplanki]